MSNLISIIIFLPLLGAALTMLARSESAIKWSALGVTSLTFLLSIGLLAGLAGVIGLMAGWLLATWLLNITVPDQTVSIEMDTWVVSKALGSALAVCLPGGAWAFHRLHRSKLARFLGQLDPPSVSELEAPEPAAVAAAYWAALRHLDASTRRHGAELLAVFQPVSSLRSDKPLTAFEVAVNAHEEADMPGRGAYYQACADAILARRSEAEGSRSDGLSTKVLPQAMATGNIQHGTIIGKLNGEIPATTPIGCRRL